MSSSISRVRVRYAETDKMGVVYYANYFVWFEVARTNLLRDAGWTFRDMEQSGFMLPVVEAQCTYRAPAQYDDELEIRTRGELLSPVRIKFLYEVSHADGRVLLADGQTVHASVNASGRPTRLPARALAIFNPAGV